MTKPTKQTRCGDCKHWSWVALRSDCNEGRCWWSQDKAVPQWSDYHPCVFDTDVTRATRSRLKRTNDGRLNAIYPGLV